MNTHDFRKYFNRKKPVGSVILSILGIPIFLSGIMSDGGLVGVIIGAIMSVIGICNLVRFFTRQTDSAIDRFCNAQADSYYAEKKNMVNSQDSNIVDTIYSSGYCYENVFNARCALRGNDKTWRSSIFKMSCIFLSEDMVYYFSKKISLITNEKSENQKEFRLQDIQMVSLEENDRSIAVIIATPGNENLYINCRNREEANEICNKLKSKVYKKEQL